MTSRVIQAAGQNWTVDLCRACLMQMLLWFKKMMIALSGMLQGRRSSRVTSSTKVALFRDQTPWP